MIDALNPTEADDILSDEMLATFPRLGEALVTYDQELSDFQDSLEVHIVDEAPEGYVALAEIGGHNLVSSKMSAAFTLMRMGCPMAILATKDEEGLSLVVDAAAESSFRTLISELNKEMPSRLANEIAGGSITPKDIDGTSYHVVPIANPDILWAHGQGILSGAFLNSTMIQYLLHGVDEDSEPMFVQKARLAEGLIQQGVEPLALETVLGLGMAAALKVLYADQAIAHGLGFNPEDLPSVDHSRLDYTDEQFQADYWSFFAKLFEGQEKR